MSIGISGVFVLDIFKNQRLCCRVLITHHHFYHSMLSPRLFAVLQNVSSVLFRPFPPICCKNGFVFISSSSSRWNLHSWFLARCVCFRLCRDRNSLQ